MNQIPIGTPGLEAGARGKRLRHFMPPKLHLNTLIEASGRDVLARARFLVRNNAYAANGRDFFTAQAVGTGITPSWKNLTGRTNRKKALNTAWLRWTDEADAEGLTDFYGLQARVADELFQANECFVRLRARRPEDGLSVPLQLQVLPSEMLPQSDSRVLPNGNEVRQGIEFDQIGRRVAYHFYVLHPDDAGATRRGVRSDLQTRVPADQVLHVIDPMEAGQIRGLSRMAPAIVPLWLLDLYDDAELDRKRTAALFAIFRKMNGAFDPSTEGAEDEGNGTASQDLTPGTQLYGEPGEEIQVIAPADVGGSYEAFQYRNLLRAASGLRIPYVGLTGDMVKANYGNIRAALIDFRRRMESLQHRVLVFQLCRPVMNAWLRAAILAGAVQGLTPANAVRLMPQLSRVTWIPPRWEWVDPSKDVRAAKEEVQAGFRSRSSVVEARGDDPEEVDREIAEERRRERELGLEGLGSSFNDKAPVQAAPPVPDPPDDQEDAPEPAQQDDTP
nr:phage portal protein [Falsiroseomonas frigidaquae]